MNEFITRERKVVKAIQFDGKNALDVCDWANNDVDDNVVMTSFKGRSYLVINIEDRNYREDVYTGDWIIRNGSSLFSMNDDKFNEKYEKHVRKQLSGHKEGKDLSEIAKTIGTNNDEG